MYFWTFPSVFLICLFICQYNTFNYGYIIFYILYFLYFRIFCSLFNELIFSEFPVQQVILTLSSLKIYYLPVFESQEWEQCSWVVLAQGSHEVQLSVGAAVISSLDWNWEVCLQTHSYGSCLRDTNNMAARRDPTVQERDNKGPRWNTQFYIS